MRARTYSTLNLEMSYRILGVGFFGITGILASASVARAPAWQILSLLGKLMNGGQERGRGKRNGGEMGKKRGGEGERKGIGNTCSGLTAGLPPPLPHPDNRTQQRRELGQKWCEAECEGDDTWVRVELGKMATSKC